jgi:hypothetical protein
MCWANPQNKEHRPWSAKLRLRDIRRLKKPVPECMKELALQESGGEGNKTVLGQSREVGKYVAPTKEMMHAFGANLHALCEEGMEYEQAVEESFAVMFGMRGGVKQKEDPDPCPVFMQRHLDDDPGLQASSRSGEALKMAQIKCHLSFLN